MEEEAIIVGTAQSSVHRSGALASRLIDGKGLDGKWSSRGCAETDEYSGTSIEWFSLELQVSKKITRVQIANRMRCCLERGKNIRITIGPSNDYDPSEPLCLPEIPQLVNKPGLQDYVCLGDLQGKFVKISRAGKINLCEVKVFTDEGKYMRNSSCMRDSD